MPGPLIKVDQNTRVRMRVTNALPAMHPTFGYAVATSVHLHGSASLPQYDGYADDVTMPGQSKDYWYPNHQRPRTLWYHDHGVHHTAAERLQRPARAVPPAERLGEGRTSPRAGTTCR